MTRNVQTRGDIYDSAKRSEIMSRIRGADTKPELLLRSLLHRLGFRFRVHRKDLPGHPDIVLPKYHTAVFVHGCFWHQHPRCRRATVPATRRDWWKAKFKRNAARDVEVRRNLDAMGWNSIVIWECELRNPQAVAVSLKRRLRRR